MRTLTIPSPDFRGLLAPLVPALPSAAVSIRPALAVLPLLSPVLRQRVQILSSSSSEPWIRLLCYDHAKANRLAAIAKGSSFEPHPVSGEVDIDWVTGIDVRYRRLDPETFHALAVIWDLDIAFQLVYCGGEGDYAWKVGEVTVADKFSTLSSFSGFPTIQLAEQAYATSLEHSATARGVDSFGSTKEPYSFEAQIGEEEEEEEEDYGYWDRYDATPARTPAAKRSPGPVSALNPPPDLGRSSSAEEAYFARYDFVQPALDSNDPGQESNIAEIYDTPQNLGNDHMSHYYRPAAALSPLLEQDEPVETNNSSQSLANLPGDEGKPGIFGDEEARETAHGADDHFASLVHPRPASSASSGGSHAVARLEETAGRQEQSELAVRQHISWTIRNLSVLARESGIDRDEFEQLVRAELATP